MSKKKFKTILCGCITALCLLLTSCGSLQISQGSGNQDSDRGNQTTTETTFASTGNIESVDTLEEVPAERTILAIPFYTRLWKTAGGALTSEAIGMDEAALMHLRGELEKEDGKTGIGLGNIFRRIRAMYQDGNVEIYSKKDVGTVVKIQIRHKEVGEHDVPCVGGGR